MDQLLERYLDQFDGAASTLTLYQGYVRNHISPFLGKVTGSLKDVAKVITAHEGSTPLTGGG